MDFTYFKRKIWQRCVNTDEKNKITTRGQNTSDRVKQNRIYFKPNCICTSMREFWIDC